MNRHLICVVASGALALTALTGCSTTPSAPTHDDGATRSASAAPSSIEPSQSKDTFTLAGSTFDLPTGLNWAKEGPTTESDVKQVAWTATDPGTGVNRCRIMFVVQDNFPNSKDDYKVILMGSETFKGFQDDRNAPAGGWGLIARYAGGTGDSAFTSTIVTRVDAAKQKVSLSVAAANSAKGLCDPDTVTGTLRKES